MKALLLASALASITVGIWLQTSVPGALQTNILELQKAKGLSAKFTIVKPSGDTAEGTLLYGKAGNFRIETPEKSVVSDGKLLWELDKKGNAYTESDAKLLAPTLSDEVWAWAAFFHPEPFKTAVSFAPGAKRVVKGNPVQEWQVAFPDRSLTLYVDQKSGQFRGATVKRGDKETLIISTALEVLEEAPNDSKFAFAPNGAKKVDPNAVVETTYAQIAPFLNRSCTGCHNAQNPKDGVDLSSYAAIIAKPRLVVVGNPAGSTLVRVVSGPRPEMPKGGKPVLTPAEVATLESWIKNGAKG
jgi:outer membrane lipoprotein-sorting protein